MEKYYGDPHVIGYLQLLIALIWLCINFLAKCVPEVNRQIYKFQTL